VFGNGVNMSTRKQPQRDAYKDLIRSFHARGTIISEDHERAFLLAHRAYFVPKEQRGAAGVDAPTPIPGGQTNSQPTTVAIMLGELEPRSGESVIDVGFGSGWTTALLAALVGKEGRVFGIELSPQAYEFGARNLAYFREVAGFDNIELKQGDGKEGWPEYAPFHRILVSAGACEVPTQLIKQLAAGGRLVIPVDEQEGSQSLVIVERSESGALAEHRIPGFRFVPLL